MRRLTMLLVLPLAYACGEDGSSDDIVPPPRDGGVARDGGEAPPRDGGVLPVGIPVLGNGTHDEGNVVIETIGTRADGLDTPRDLELNPAIPTELWVVNRVETVTVYENVGTPSQTSGTYSGGGSQHFLAQPAALAFGAPGTFATIHETDELTQGPNGTPADFMGPTLWDATLALFNGGHSSHLDMLHNSPNGMGIAWEAGNAYWIFDGYHSAIARYDFHMDHDRGGADHSDGEIARYAEGEVQRLADVPSHMELDRTTGLLYIADTGNNRIAVLDTSSGTRGGTIRPNYDGIDQYMMNDAVVTTLVDGVMNGVLAPSGLALADGIIYVTDNQTSAIHGFDLDGERVDYLPTSIPAGSLMGIEVDGEGRLLIVDAIGDRVLRISPRP